MYIEYGALAFTRSTGSGVCIYLVYICIFSIFTVFSLLSVFIYLVYLPYLVCQVFSLLIFLCVEMHLFCASQRRYWHAAGRMLPYADVC